MPVSNEAAHLAMLPAKIQHFSYKTLCPGDFLLTRRNKYGTRVENKNGTGTYLGGLHFVAVGV